MYAESRPAVVRCGWGPDATQNGGSAIAAILALPAVAGKFGVAGGGFTMSQSFAWDVDPMAGVAPPLPRTREINMNRLGEVLAPDFQPPIRAIFVYNCNPLSTVPEQNKIRAGLLREDLFTVVHEQVLTDTARYADVLLPATTFLEHAELRRSYGAMLAQYCQPVIEPVGEARSNHWLFGELCRRMDLTRPGEPETPDDLVQAIIATSASSAELARSFAATGRAVPPCGRRPVPFVDVFPGTADRRIDLCPIVTRSSEHLRPLHLSPHSGKREVSALLDFAIDVEGHFLDLVPTRARNGAAGNASRGCAVRGISDGDAVRMFNDSGEVRCAAKINSDLRPGVVVMPKGLWARHTHNGQTTNALVPDTLSDVGGRRVLQRFARADRTDRRIRFVKAARLCRERNGRRILHPIRVRYPSCLLVHSIGEGRGSTAFQSA